MGGGRSVQLVANFLQPKSWSQPRARLPFANRSSWSARQLLNEPLDLRCLYEGPATTFSRPDFAFGDGTIELASAYVEKRKGLRDRD